MDTKTEPKVSWLEISHWKSNTPFTSSGCFFKPDPKIILCCKWAYRQTFFIALFFSVYCLAFSPSLSAQNNIVSIIKAQTPKLGIIEIPGKEQSNPAVNHVQIYNSENICQQSPQGIMLELGDILPADIPSLPKRVSLEAFDVLYPDTKLIAATDQGDRTITAKLSSYKGLLGSDGSINLNFTPHGIIGIIRWSNKTYMIQPVQSNISNADNGDYIIRETAPQKQGGEWCGVDTQALSPQTRQFMAGLNMNPVKSPGDQLTAKLAVETDYETYVSFEKDSVLTAAYLLSIIASVSQIYETEVNIRLQVVYCRVWTTPEDPYTQLGFSLYPEFANYWNANMQHIDRDAALLIIKDPSRLGGGLASLDALCNKAMAYAISGETVLTVAHELGHTFGSPHTHNCSWPAGPNGTLAPIDQCASVEGGCGSNEIIAQEGTIMSYCPTMSMVFHPLCRNLIRARAEASTCLGSGTEPVNTVSGKVSLHGAGLADVKIYASRNSGSLVSTSTDADGFYTLTLFNESYILSANRENYLINPIGYNSVAVDVIVAGVDVTGVNFNAIELPADQYEPDDIYSNAATIRSDEIIQNHTLHNDTDHDFVRFEALAGKTYSIDLHVVQGTQLPRLSLLDSDGITEIKNTVYPPHLEWKAVIGGTYYIQVYGSKGFYGLSVSTAFSKVATDIFPLKYPAADWGDYDNDGDPDLLVAGMNDTYTFEIDLYKNDNGQFINTQAGIDQIPTTGSFVLKWVDIDNDGELDAFIGTGENAYIYINEGGVFTSRQTVDDKLGYLQTADFGDYDNDGDLDILINSWSDWNYGEYLRPKIYRNDNGSFVKTILNIRGVNYGKEKWTDFDGDGDLDIVVAGSSSKNGDPGSSNIDPFTKVYRNDNGNFTDANSELKPFTDFPDFVFGDFDSDGDPDLAIAGKETTTLVTKIYRNDNGIYTDINAELTGVRNAMLAWGDYDNDGDLDLFAAGQEKESAVSSSVSKLYINKAGTFEEASFNGIFPGITGTVTSCDYDKDNDLDLFLVGEAINMKGQAYLIRNETDTINAPPNEITGLNAINDKGKVTLSWDVSQDDRTPSQAMTYNLRIGTSPGGIDVLSPMSDLNNGFRQITGMGNAGQLLHYTVYNLPQKTYYWSVQAIDNAFAGSQWAPEQSFTVNPVVGLGILTADSPSFIIYPNPSNGQFRLLLNPERAMDFDLKVINSVGKVVEKRHIKSAGINHKELFIVTDLKKGIYFLIISSDKYQSSEKIVVQ